MLNPARKCTSCEGKGKIYYHENKICKKCRGSGRVKGSSCTNCKGAGIFMRRRRKTCLRCQGTGKKKSLFPQRPAKGVSVSLR